MKRFLLLFALMNAVFLLGLMALSESEGTVTAARANRWTARHDHDDPWLRYVILSGGVKEGLDLRPYARTHYGFPCRALIADVAVEGDGWYAKLDMWRLALNELVAAALAVSLAAIVTFAVKRRRQAI